MKEMDKVNSDRQAITTQPSSEFIPGLELLQNAEHLFVKQEMEFFEAFTGYETNNRYWIKTTNGQCIYSAVEETDCLTRQCAGSLRPFIINIRDARLKDVMQVYRPMRCDTCCCPCCLQKVEVMAPPGRSIGWVIQSLTCCYPKFKVKNEKEETKMTIRGPVWTCSCCYEDVEFTLYNEKGETIGRITKHWSGFLKEIITDADLFGISFPPNLDVKMKATLLGATLLIDYMFFEDPACGKRKDMPGMCCR